MNGDDKTFYLFWKDGEHNSITGSSIAKAFVKAGYGAGAMSALSFHSTVDCREHYNYNEELGWLKKPSISE